MLLRPLFFTALAGLVILAGLPDFAGASVRMILNTRPATAKSAASESTLGESVAGIVTTPDSATAQASFQLLHGGTVSRDMAVHAGRHAVRLRALQQAARRLSTRPAARLVTDEIPRLMALSAPMHAIVVNEEDLTPDTVRVFAHWEQSRAEEAVLREHTATEQSLDFQVMAYGVMRELSGASLRLLRDAAILRRENGDDSPQAQRLEGILQRMVHLDAYLRGPFPPEAKELAVYLAADPQNPVYLLEFAAAQLRASHPASALNTLKKLDAATAEHPRVLYLQGLAELALRLPGLALRDFSKALVINPDDPAFWEARAGAYNALGDSVAMCGDLQKSCSLGMCATLEEARLRGVCSE